MIICKTDNCFGCGLCSNICPKSAIELTPDENGFLHPTINESKCVECGLCKNNCPVNKPSNYHVNSLTRSYSVKNKDVSIQQKSSSGGFFFAAASFVLKNNGSVYGCILDEQDELKPMHVRIDSNDELPKMLGSKYVQSDASSCFKLVEQDLKKGKIVLFSGTPCQISALKTFINFKNCSSSNLFLVDVVCHGVPSPLLWKDFIFILKNKKGAVKSYRFRYKDDKHFWGKVNVSYSIGDKEVVNDRLAKSFIELYFTNVATRESCFSCKYATTHRAGDITMADCWGIENESPDFYDKRGVSLILVNTTTGKMLFDLISSTLIYKEVDIDKLNQIHLSKPVKKPSTASSFWKDFTRNGYIYVAKKYTTFGFKNRVKFGFLVLINKMVKVFKR